MLFQCADPSLLSSPCQLHESFFFLLWQLYHCYQTLRIVQSVWCRMDKNPLTIGVICVSFISTKLVSQNLQHPWDIPRGTLGCHCTQFGNHWSKVLPTVFASLFSAHTWAIMITYFFQCSFLRVCQLLILEIRGNITH